MADRLMQALHTLDEVERTAHKRSPLKQIDARAKIIVTVIFLVAMLSMPLERISELLLFAIYPIVLAAMGGISYASVARQSLIVLPFVALIALPNIFYDRTPMFSIGSLMITRGWVTMFSIMLRGVLSVQAVMILISSTGIYRTCRALHRLGMPALLASQIFIMIRYIRLILEQALAMRRSRDARSFGRGGYPLSIWATLIGQLLLRSIRRGEAIGEAMTARGFENRMPAISFNHPERWRRRDTLYTFSWCATLIFIRIMRIAEHLF